MPEDPKTRERIENFVSEHFIRIGADPEYWSNMMQVVCDDIERTLNQAAKAMRGG